MFTRSTIVMLATGIIGTGLLAGSALAQSDQTNEGQNKSEKDKPGKQGEATSLGIESNSQYGQYLVDGKGNSLYVFTSDKHGTSSCSGACARAWPPLTTTSTPEAAAPSLDASKLGTITRRDGTKQVTFNGKPLYRHARDTAANEVRGQGMHSFGGEWALVAPDGSMIKAQSKGAGTEKSDQKSESKSEPPKSEPKSE